MNPPNSAALTRSTTTSLAAVSDDRAAFFSPRQREMIRNMFAGGADEQEFQALMAIAETRKLNPLLKQVYFIKRWDSQKKQEVWSVQTSIEGLRVIAERTGLYDGADAPKFEYNKDGSIKSATVTVYRKDRSRPISSTVFYAEAVQTTRDGNPTSFWARMPHRMLAKVAEADALHRAFPEDTGGLDHEDDVQMHEEAPVEAAPAPAKRAERPASARAAAAPAPTPAPAPSPAPAPEPELPPAAVEAVVEEEPAHAAPQDDVADAEFEADAEEDVGAMLLPFDSGAWAGKRVSDLKTEKVCQTFYKGFADVAAKATDPEVVTEKGTWAARIAEWATLNGWSVK
jgi:phage recombination protein Bet